MKDISVAVRRTTPVKRVHTLRGKQELDFCMQNDWCHFTVPSLDLVEAVVLE